MGGTLLSAFQTQALALARAPAGAVKIPHSNRWFKFQSPDPSNVKILTLIRASQTFILLAEDFAPWPILLPDPDGKPWKFRTVREELYE